MKKVQNIIKRLKLIEKDLDKNITLRKTISENKEIIIDLNAEEQLFEKGENSLGVKISDYAPYSPITIEIKREKGQPTNRVTLRDTGDFEESFFLNIGSDSFRISATDEKTSQLIRKYGKDIFGLNEENKNELLNSYIKPAIEKMIKKYMNG